MSAISFVIGSKAAGASVPIVLVTHLSVWKSHMSCEEAVDTSWTVLRFLRTVFVFVFIEVAVRSVVGTLDQIAGGGSSSAVNLIEPFLTGKCRTLNVAVR